MTWSAGTNKNSACGIQASGFRLVPERVVGIGPVDDLSHKDDSRVAREVVANTHAPAYHVVVGDVLGAKYVAHVTQKLGPSEFATITAPNATAAMPFLASAEAELWTDCRLAKLTVRFTSSLRAQKLRRRHQFRGRYRR
jgi:hypothetical protein